MAFTGGSPDEHAAHTGLRQQVCLIGDRFEVQAAIVLQGREGGGHQTAKSLHGVNLPSSYHVFSKADFETAQFRRRFEASQSTNNPAEHTFNRLERAQHTCRSPTARATMNTVRFPNSIASNN